MKTQTADKLLSFEEYLNYDDGTDNRYELVLGKLEIMNPPTVRHFLIAKFLEQVFDREIKNKNLNWLCFREAGIRTGWQKSRLPDLFVIDKNSAMELLDDSAVFQTTPFLIVEIVSPESAKRDYRYKRSEYAALEVPEYWIVDPQENKITVLVLNEGLYEETVFTKEEKIVSPTFTELELTVKEVLFVK
jgi:Uma2 family endonuclease